MPEGQANHQSQASRMISYKDLAMKRGCTSTCASTDEGQYEWLNGLILAFGKGNLLRQVIVQQSKCSY